MCVATIATGGSPMGVFIDSMLIGGGQSILSLQGQQRQAGAAASQYKAETDAANKAWQDAAVQENEVLLNKKQDAAHRTQEHRIETMRAAGQALASARGSGMNLDMLLGDYERVHGNYLSNLEMSMDQERRQSWWNQQGHLANRQNRVNAAYQTASQVSRPNYLGALLGLGGTAMGAYSQYSAPDPATGGRTLHGTTKTKGKN